METHFTISLTALRLFRQCMEEAFGSPRTIVRFLLESGRKHGCHVLSAWSRQRAESMTWKAMIASSWPGSDVFYAWPPWTTGPFLRLWRIMQQCCNWKWSCHTEPPGVTFMPSSAGTLRVSLKLLWATGRPRHAACRVGVCSGGVVAICRLALYRRSATGGDFLDFVTVRGCP